MRFIYFQLAPEIDVQSKVGEEWRRRSTNAKYFEEQEEYKEKVQKYLEWQKNRGNRPSME